jgi:hypothetical protein
MMSHTHPQSGNILFYILIAVVLIGALTVALRDTGGLSSGVDREAMALKAIQAQRQAANVAAGVDFLIKNGVSESDIRFAHPNAPVAYGVVTATPQNQVFSNQGGQASYPIPPKAVGSDGSDIPHWIFTGDVNGLQSGSDRADLVAVLSGVSLEFCNAINAQIGYAPGTQPRTAGIDCIDISSAFTGSFEDTTPITMLLSSFSRVPALQACVACNPGPFTTSYHYYHVLLAR